MKLIKSYLLTLVILLFCIACGGSEEGGTETGTTTPVISTSLKLANASEPAALKTSALQAGQVTTEGLTSFKYYITSITICEDMEITGTAFNNPTGCIALYVGNQNDSRYTYELDDDFAPFGDVARSSDEGFVDLMNDASRATLSSTTTLTSEDVRSYQYGYITWYLPVKVTAEIPLSDGTIYRTKDGTTVTPEGGQGPITTATTNFDDGADAEEAVVVLGNGGSWFKFQNPFVITQEDIDSNTEYSLDLTLDPDGLLKAYEAGVGGCGGCILQDPVGNQILVPMLDLTPVPHKTDENVMKETYVSTVETGEDIFDIRFDLYYIDVDTQKTIYGVNTNTLINSDTTTAVSPFPKVSFITTDPDGNLEFQDHNGDEGPLVSGFVRQTEVGSSFTATLHCGESEEGGFAADDCSDGETKEITFTLQSLSILE